jgi:hypothetical protein
MLEPFNTLDDLDLEDRDYMDTVRNLKKLDLDRFLNQYLKVTEPELYDKLISTCKTLPYKK